MFSDHQEVILIQGQYGIMTTIIMNPIGEASTAFSIANVDHGSMFSPIITLYRSVTRGLQIRFFGYLIQCNDGTPAWHHSMRIKIKAWGYLILPRMKLVANNQLVH